MKSKIVFPLLAALSLLAVGCNRSKSETEGTSAKASAEALSNSQTDGAGKVGQKGGSSDGHTSGGGHVNQLAVQPHVAGEEHVSGASSIPSTPQAAPNSQNGPTPTPRQSAGSP